MDGLGEEEPLNGEDSGSEEGRRERQGLFARQLYSADPSFTHTFRSSVFLGQLTEDLCIGRLFNSGA